jgi:hypothetical protein
MRYKSADNIKRWKQIFGHSETNFSLEYATYIALIKMDKFSYELCRKHRFCIHAGAPMANQYLKILPWQGSA